MRLIIFACLLAVAAARPQGYQSSPARAQVWGTSDEIPILRDDRVHSSAAGEYSLDTETGDGIIISKSGYGPGPDGHVENQGSVIFITPDGEEFKLTYVATAERGYQPKSTFLPVAPAFPHPIPHFDQIAFTATKKSSEEE